MTHDNDAEKIDFEALADEAEAGYDVDPANAVELPHVVGGVTVGGGAVRLPRSFVVSMCHNGTDWCVRKATKAEFDDPEVERLNITDARALAALTAEELGCKWFDFSEDDPEADPLTAAVEEALNQIEEKRVAAVKDVFAYAEHLRAGKPAEAISLWKGPFEAAKPYADDLVQAHRALKGLPKNPFRAGTEGARMFDVLREAGGPVKAQDLTKGRFQVETYLKERILRERGWALTKTKLDGKVAYELSRVLHPEEVAS